ncbi:LysR family transcriptional regulator [Cupriavidus plantarum]|uniref:LysR family transcriptional regulator n=1 Tax=Cupriavidus plantarum TaxID=942865 RepID=UPI0015C8F0E6|nr:LysR family transcriptional regulator [Cupriavidus plantarum]NYI02743.1 DNA-binding transcriptional LysR family regulator [Cupriavidus plantarum]
MEALNLLESFVHSADTCSFSAAARRLGVTPAAVSKNVARLERHLGLRLFQRSTRKLTLTQGGEQFLRQISKPYATLREAFADAAQDAGTPAGVLRVSMGFAFGRQHLLPLLNDFLARYPAIVPDWHFDNRAVDLIRDGFDAAIGSGIEIAEGVVARELARSQMVVSASPAYMEGRPMPRHPSDLAELDGIARRSSSTGRLRAWTLRSAVGEEAPVSYRIRAIFDDPEAMAQAAIQGLGIALLPMAHAARWLESGTLLRLLPGWYADNGQILLYYPNKTLLPARTRAFVDFVIDAFRTKGVARHLDGR